jgi:hypothetical protein
MCKLPKPFLRAAWKANAMFDAPEESSRLLGGYGVILTAIDKATQRHIAFASAGPPSVARDKYCAHYAAINPRIPPVLRQHDGAVGWDYKILR